MKQYPIKVKVVSVELIGPCYRRGQMISGQTWATLDNGKLVYLGDHTIKGFDEAHDLCDQLGFDTRESRARVANWVKLGSWEMVAI